MWHTQWSLWQRRGIGPPAPARIVSVAKRYVCKDFGPLGAGPARDTVREPVNGTSNDTRDRIPGREGKATWGKGGVCGCGSVEGWE